MQPILRAAMLLIVLVMSACYYDNLDELQAANVKPCVVPDTASYSIHVKPILEASCGASNSACHASKVPANLFVGLNNHADVQASISQNLMNAINHTGNASPMPKGGGKLDDCRINTIQKWIDQGALNN